MAKRKNNTLARSSEIPIPGGGTLVTPLLVPSFSSKGFGVSGNGDSEIYHYFNVAAEILTESMLVSAYDIAHGFLPQMVQPITDITFVDSGGYETSDIQDLSAVFRNPVEKKEWKKEDLKRVYDNWSNDVPAVFVNYDDADLRCGINDQIEAAEDLLLPYRHQLKALLIKPETKTQTLIKTENVVANIKKLRNFDIIGFTEKELGGSLIDRMKTIASIRLAMDDESLTQPIHIFGSLDPVSSPLYFLAGAEIFDGLTWLRFGYRQGVACYVHNAVALENGIDKKQPFFQSLGLAANYSYLVNLQNEMKKYLLDKDFQMFKFNSNFFRESFDHLRTRIGRLK